MYALCSRITCGQTASKRSRCKKREGAPERKTLPTPICFRYNLNCENTTMISSISRSFVVASSHGDLPHTSHEGRCTSGGRATIILNRELCRQVQLAKGRSLGTDDRHLECAEFAITHTFQLEETGGSITRVQSRKNLSWVGTTYAETKNTLQPFLPLTSFCMN